MNDKEPEVKKANSSFCDHILRDGTSAWVDKGYDVFGYPVERCSLCGAKY